MFVGVVVCVNESSVVVVLSAYPAPPAVVTDMPLQALEPVNSYT